MKARAHLNRGARAPRSLLASACLLAFASMVPPATLAQSPPRATASSDARERPSSAHAEAFEQRRAHAHALALEAKWAQAADAFRALAAESDQPMDRLAAMRSLAQVSRVEEAIVEGERVVRRRDELDSETRGAALIELANLHESNGYRLRREGKTREAVLAFERAYELDDSRTRLLAEAGYARLAIGDRAGAADRFVQALDRLPQTAQPGQANAAASGVDPTLRDRLRREVSEARRNWTLAAFQSWRPRGTGVGSGAASTGGSGSAAGLQRDGLIAAQGGAELSLRLPDLRSAMGTHRAEVFARTLWSQRENSLAINERSVQGGVGLRWQPISDSALRLTAERLIAVGEDARNDWLLRLAWGVTTGDQAPAASAYWPSGQAYIEAGRFFGDGGSTAYYGEARLGMATSLGAQWTVTPHGVIAAREVRPDAGSESWAELGAGLAFRRPFGGSQHEADRGRLEWLVQYRTGVSGSGRSGWLFAGSVIW